MTSRPLVVEGGVMLKKPLSAAECEAAWQRVEEAMSSVRPTPAQAAKPAEVQEQEILEIVKEVRKEMAEERQARSG